MSPPPSRRVLSQVFSLFDEQQVGSLSGEQFFSLVRALLSVHRGEVLAADSEEVLATGRAISSRLRIRTPNQLAYDEFVAACEHFGRRGSPFEPFFPTISAFFSEEYHPILNELFPFHPTYEYQVLYDWQSVPSNCESILPLNEIDHHQSSHHHHHRHRHSRYKSSIAHPLASFGTKRARISEECQFSFYVGKPSLLDPVRVRVRKDHTISELLEKAANAWPSHYRPAPLACDLKLVWYRKDSADFQGVNDIEEVILPLTTTVQNVNLFFIYRDCKIHASIIDQDPPPAPSTSSVQQSPSPPSSKIAQHTTESDSGFLQREQQSEDNCDDHREKFKNQAHEENEGQKPPPLSTPPSSAQLLLSRLGDEFSLIRVGMQQEARRIDHQLELWEDALTSSRDQLPPPDTSWPDGSILSAVDQEDLKVQAAALKADLKSIRSCINSLQSFNR